MVLYKTSQTEVNMIQPLVNIKVRNTIDKVRNKIFSFI